MLHASGHCVKIDPCDDNWTTMEMNFGQLEMSSFCFMFICTLKAVLHVSCRLLLPFSATSPNPSYNSFLCLVKNYTEPSATLGLCALTSHCSVPPTPFSLAFLSLWAPVSSFPSSHLATLQRIVMLFIICIIPGFAFPWLSFPSSCCQDTAELPAQKCLEWRKLHCF